jgi:hypothetical protein
MLRYALLLTIVPLLLPSLAFAQASQASSRFNCTPDDTLQQPACTSVPVATWPLLADIYNSDTAMPVRGFDAPK